jgi:hypothetical protein
LATKKKKATPKVPSEKKTWNSLFNSIHDDVDRLHLILCSSDAENITNDEMLFVATSLRALSAYTHLVTLKKDKKKTPREDARRKEKPSAKKRTRSAASALR